MKKTYGRIFTIIHIIFLVFFYKFYVLRNITTNGTLLTMDEQKVIEGHIFIQKNDYFKDDSFIVTE